MSGQKVNKFKVTLIVKSFYFRNNNKYFPYNMKTRILNMTEYRKRNKVCKKKKKTYSLKFKLSLK